MTVQSRDPEQIALKQKCAELKVEFDRLYSHLKTTSGHPQQSWIANLIKEHAPVLSLCERELDYQSKKLSYSAIAERFERINPKLKTKIDELVENAKSPPINPFDKNLRWWVLAIPMILGLLLWAPGLFSYVGSTSTGREASILSLIAFLANLGVVLVLYHGFHRNRLKKFPDNDAGHATKFFQLFWQLALFSWGVMYLTLAITQGILLIATRVDSGLSILMPVKVDAPQWTFILHWFAYVASALNSAFLYMCFLVLSVNIPLRKRNLRLRVRFQHFISILAGLLFLGLIDELLTDNVFFNGFAMTLFLAFMAATFILLASKLDSSMFKTELDIFRIGTVYFYAATMTVFAIVQDGKVTAVSLIAFTIFFIGKYVFGNIINDRVRIIDKSDKSTNELQLYLETLYGIKKKASK